MLAVGLGHGVGRGCEKVSMTTITHEPLGAVHKRKPTRVFHGQFGIGRPPGDEPAGHEASALKPISDRLVSPLSFGWAGGSQSNCSWVNASKRLRVPARTSSR